MKRRTWLLLIAAGALVVSPVAYLVAEEYFLPEAAQTRNEAFEDITVEGAGSTPAAGQPTPSIVKSGAFQDGEPGHRVRGEVALVRGANGFFLRFTDYEQTQGPDVFIFLTHKPHQSSASAVESGLRVLVPGGADGGESTIEGSFNVPLPADIDPSAWGGVTAWCDRYNVNFGTAGLVPQ